MATNAARVRAGIQRERLFYTGMAMLVLVSTFVGFAPSYYLRFTLPPPHPLEALTPLVFAHGLIFSSWVLLFMAQTTLVAAGRTDLHRRLGILGVALLVLMVPIAAMVGIGGIDRPLTAPPGIPPLSWAAISLLDVPVFSGLIIAALLNRRRAAVHKRLMLAAMVDMLRPSMGRLFPMLGLGGPVALTAPLVFLLPQIVYDWRTRGRVHPATWAGTAAVAGVTLATPLVWNTPAWLAFAASLKGLI